MEAVIEGTHQEPRDLGEAGLPLAGRDGEGLPKEVSLFWASACCARGRSGRNIQEEGPEDKAMLGNHNTCGEAEAGVAGLPPEVRDELGRQMGAR